MPIRAAFVMEQTLGHVTHAQNLRAAVERDAGLDPSWIPIDFGLRGLGRFVPGYNSNWSVRASLLARSRVTREHARRPFAALFFHTQVTALFCSDLMRRVPSVISLDATPINFDTVGASYGHRAAGNGWLDARKFELNRRALQRARAVVAWSEWCADSLVEHYGVPRDRVLVRAPGATAPYFAIGAARERAVDDGGPIRLLFVGGDFARKGGLTLLQALRAARTRRPIELHVVTRDAVTPQDNVIVHHGVRPNSDELLGLLARADVFVLPTMGECLSIALMEAAAAGLPIITTDVGALREAAVHMTSALIVPPGDASALRAAIERLAGNDPLRLRLGRAGHALARTKFDAAANNAAICDLVRSVATQADLRGAA